MSENYPVPYNETERLLKLSDLDIDYGSLSESFKDLTHLAAKVAGTEISLINLIDAYTQWTVARHGLDLHQMTREESVCQYTITQADQFEVPDLSADDRFNKNFYVGEPLSLRYYFGVPLKDNDGLNIGALCVLDTKLKMLSPEKIELLKIIAVEIMNRIKTYQTMESLQNKLKDAGESNKKVAHDIRGPIAGIIGLSEIITEQGKNANLDQVIEFIKLIHNGSKSLLDLADEILSDHNEVKAPGINEFDLSSFRAKLLELYGPQAAYKKINLKITINPDKKNIIFSKNKLLQINGNLISNAVKFTPAGGTITVELDLLVKQEANILQILVADSGVGISEDEIVEILTGGMGTKQGTGGEKGYGFGLSLVKHLIDKMHGEMFITSEKGKGTIFRIELPQSNL
ncbi:GAF domain-containing sensor histidine kinase [Pedobacter alluvionis]|uniref:histidine kinase n=1 Tax=Pedobacter alluvionis TaxID=475253 RepID=A0A497YG95_9SPHI|nr:GAF domain-containing sensor histidine kinase [Pedobacter alluvionis]RLJ79410.1 GAF domain-containing protein [Pedobacter alluvionis]TFB30761.1 sensor histidine kinase [Pedobacter alluvionis]